MSTLDRLQHMLAADYQIPQTRSAPSAALEDLGMDSLGVMELLFKVEDEFHIHVPTTQTSLLTIQDVVDFIDQLVKTQNAELGSGSRSN
ncbi:MAG TPA: phosphopantetheine-binding protein [Paralcaligenes sp.]|jgi:Acyl carrier protein